MSGRPRWFLAVLLGALVLLVFSDCVSFGFVWDDEHYIQRNTYLTSWRYLPQLLTQNVDAGAGVRSNLYRPLEMLTHFLDVRLWGYQAWAHHLATVLIHAATTIAIFFWLCRLAPVPGAAAATLLYSLHPMHSLAVPYIPGRVDDLAILFLCLGLLAFERHLGWSLLCAALALLAKEHMALFPVFLWLFLTAAGQRASWRRHLPFWLLSASYVLLRLTVLNFHNTLNFYDEDNLLTQHPEYRLFTYLTTLPQGMRLWLWPVDLHHERSWSVFTSLSAPQVWGSALGLLGWLGLAAWAWRRHRAVSAGLLWFVLATLPTSNLVVLINALFYDHWFLLPGLGLAVIVSQIGRLRFAGTHRFWLLALLATLAAIPVTRRYNLVWKNAVSLNTHIVRYEPANAKVLNNLAMALADRGRLEESMRLYRQAIAISDAYPHAHHNLARLYEQGGQDDAAAEEYRKALAINPGFHHSAIALGWLELRRGKPDEAQRLFTSASAAYPYGAEAYLGLAQLKLNQGDRDGAIAELTQGLAQVDDVRLRRLLHDAGR